MPTASSKPDKQRLFSVAEAQQGYFTAGEAVECGFARSTHSYHVEKENWVREYRGIYRLRWYPISEEGQFVVWSLWSRDRRGVPQGVFSHLTALAIHEISDANPAKLHMTVPPGFRRSGNTPPVLVLHKSLLSPSEMIYQRGFAVTTPLRAITDAGKSGDASRDILQQALNEGKARGLITRKDIAEALNRADIAPWLHQILLTA